MTVPKGGNATFTVTANTDSVDEPNEPFVVSLSNPERATIETDSVTTTINDTNATPTISISGPAPIEENATNASYSVSLSAASSSTVTVNYTTANGTAAAGLDYEARNGQLSWTPGNTDSQSIVVPINEDTLDEFDETFTVTLSSASGATISSAVATTTISEDEDTEVTASITNATVTEGNTGTVDATVTVTLSGPSGKTVTVPWATAPGTASANADYVPDNGQLVFAPADPRSKTITVKVKGDTLFEPDEKFSVVITDPINGGLGSDNLGEITITDDDSSPVPTLSAPSVNEGNSGTVDLVFEATLPAPHSAVTYNFRTVSESAAHRRTSSRQRARKPSLPTAGRRRPRCRSRSR